jgi:hypothetical protein
VAMRLISSWRWNFSWRFQCSSASAFRSFVAHHLCLQNFSRLSTKYMFFVGDVVVLLQLGLAIKKCIQNLKRKLGFSKTLDWFFFVLRMIKIKRCKIKIKTKTENNHKR